MGIDRYETALCGGRFDRLPDVKAAVTDGLTGEDEMVKHLSGIYARA